MYCVKKNGLLTMLAIACSSLTWSQQVTVDSLAKKTDQLEKEVGILKNLKVNGWLQAQYQWTERRGAKTFDGGDFAANSADRFMIRRGRIKFTYTKGIAQFVLQLNATERGVNVADFFGKVTDPWTKQFALYGGVMNRPFGFEIQQSSSVRETPERSRFTQSLLPNERDMGMMLSWQPTKEKKLYGFKVDAGFFNGTGIAVPGTTSLNGAGVADFDSYKDFIGRIAYTRSFNKDKFTLGLGASHYNGGVVYQSNRVYEKLGTDVNGMAVWQASDTTSTTFKGGKAPRLYNGADVQLSFVTPVGTTSLRAEYIFGTQAGTKTVNRSPATLPALPDAYLRSFDGFYAYFIQRIGKTKHELALKYEWYDPNTKLSSGDFKTGTTMTDAELKYTMLGVGYNYYFDEHVKFMFYYNMVRNERAEGISGFSNDLKDDVFTARIQYRF